MTVIDVTLTTLKVDMAVAGTSAKVEDVTEADHSDALPLMIEFTLA